MAELARAALPRWNIHEAEVTLLKLRENAVFRVDVPAGASFVMRIHRHNYHSDGELLSELQWLQALASAGIESPQNIVPAASGRCSKSCASSRCRNLGRSICWPG